MEYRLLSHKISRTGLCLFLACPLVFSADKHAPETVTTPPPLELEGGRRLEFVRAFSSQEEIKSKHPFWNKVVDLLAGPPERTHMVRPYGVVTDSKGRVIVSDPGAGLVHIFDFEGKSYQKLTGPEREPLKSPIGVAVDEHDNIYVADSELGKVLVFDSHGKLRHYIGGLKGEGFFKRPTGIAVDTSSNRVYVTDTWRDAIYYTDLEGNILGHFGLHGSEPGQFNFPIDVMVRGEELFVVDSMNFRVQFFDRNGQYKGEFGKIGPTTGYLFRSKGLAMDSERHFYISDGMLDEIQVFDRDGTLLYYFGGSGNGFGEFQSPCGIFVDRNDRVYVADMLNHRVEVFQYLGKPRDSGN